MSWRWFPRLGVALGFWVLLITIAPSMADEPKIKTNRPGTRLLHLPKTRDVWHFVVFGDRTGGPAEGIRVLEQAVRDTNLLDPDLVMTVGDLIEGYNRTPEWLEQMREFQTTMSQLNMAWYPVAGNHDIYWRGPNRPPGEHEADYEKHFGPLWYWFQHKNAGFVVLYTDEGDPKSGQKGLREPASTQMSSEQIEWLTATLEETRELDHVFVFLHHPRWITERYRGSNWDEVHAVLAAAGNVTAVFAGHIHRMHYAGKRDGIEYFTLATTGGAKSHEIPQAGWLHHFNVVTVRKDRLSVATVPVGAVIDPRSWEVPAVFRVLTEAGGVERDEMLRVFNMGVGMIALVAPEDVDGVLESSSQSESPAWVMGEVEPGQGVRWA